MVPRRIPPNETSLFVIPTQPTNRVYNVIHLPGRHSVHLPVELIEVRADLLDFIGIVFVITLVEHG